MPARGSAAIVTVADRGWVNERMAAAGDVSASWVVSDSGQWSGRFSHDDYWQLGGDDLILKWIRYEHPTCGTWGGVILDLRGGGRDGLVEIVATTFDHVLLGGRSTAMTYRQQHGSPGGLALKAISDSQTDNAVRFSSIAADEDGDLIAMTWKGDSVADVMRSLARDSGQEWLVSCDAAGNIGFEWRVLCGSDRSHEILLREGIEIIDGGIDTSAANLANDLTGKSGDRDWEQSTTVQMHDDTSLNLYGRMQGAAIPFPRLASKAGIRAALRRELYKRRYPVTAGSITVPDTLPALVNIRDGDTVTISMHHKSASLAFRVVARSADVNSGTVDLAGYVP